ncbi:MAG: DUF4224 domain-containing protein [Bacteroides sp.]|nr:DUF4224 domain-containing protein [Bacteroides sp.]
MKALFQLPDKPDILEEFEIIRLTGRTAPAAQIRWLKSQGWLFEKNQAGEPIVSRLYFQMKMAALMPPLFFPQSNGNRILIRCDGRL